MYKSSSLGRIKNNEALTKWLLLRSLHLNTHTHKARPDRSTRKYNSKICINRMKTLKLEYRYQNKKYTG